MCLLYIWIPMSHLACAGTDNTIPTLCTRSFGPGVVHSVWRGLSSFYHADWIHDKFFLTFCISYNNNASGELKQRNKKHKILSDIIGILAIFSTLPLFIMDSSTRTSWILILLLAGWKTCRTLMKSVRWGYVKECLN